MASPIWLMAIKKSTSYVPVLLISLEDDEPVSMNLTDKLTVLLDRQAIDGDVNPVVAVNESDAEHCVLSWWMSDR